MEKKADDDFINWKKNKNKTATRKAGRWTSEMSPATPKIKHGFWTTESMIIYVISANQLILMQRKAAFHIGFALMYNRFIK